MSFLKFRVWATSNGRTEMESYFPKQHDSSALTEWLATSEMVKRWERRVWTIISISWLRAIWRESWLQTAFHSRLVHRFVTIGLEKMKFYFRICGEIVSPSGFVIVAWTQAYSFSRLIVFYFELVEMWLS